MMNKDKRCRIIKRDDKETKRLEKEEKDKKFWKSLIYNNGGLGGKKGHDN